MKEKVKVRIFLVAVIAHVVCGCRRSRGLASDAAFCALGKHTTLLAANCRPPSWALSVRAFGFFNPACRDVAAPILRRGHHAATLTQKSSSAPVWFSRTVPAVAGSRRRRRNSRL